MKLQLYDSLTQKIKDIGGREKITIYLCGPTVYDDIHIGNIAPVIIFDILVRYISELGIPYTYIHNITDIDDKIVNKAKELQTTEEEIARLYEKKYHEILEKLNIVKANFFPRVSEHIQDIQNTVDSLLKKEVGYKSEQGDILFDISKIKSYGELSKQKLDKLKEDKSSNFALWKIISEGKTWDSPWGKGRPGWHTECFTFIDKYSGGHVDIHGGGVDLKFPHHENENAHCLGLYEHNLADVWVHVGHLHTEDGKISKSTNKKFLVKDLLKEYSSNTIRYLLLGNKYSSPILINTERLQDSQREFESFLWAINQARTWLYIENIKAEKAKIEDGFLSTIGNDLNFPETVTWLQKIKKNVLSAIKNKDKEGIKQNYELLEKHLEWLGFSIPNIHTQENLNLISSWRKQVESESYDEADQTREKLKTLKLI